MIHAVKLLLSFGFSGFFLYLAFDKIDIGSFWSSLMRVSWLTIIAVSAMAVMSMFLRAWRWRILLRPVKDISYSTVFTYTMIGFMSNNILPAHAGDFLKPYLLGLKENVSGFATLATVLVERVLDGVGLIIIFLLVLPFAPLPQSLQLGGLAIGAVLFLLIGLMIILSSEKSRLRKILLQIVEKLPNRIRKNVAEKVQMFLFGLTVFQNRAQIFKLLLISAFVWAHLAATIFMILKGYPMGLDIPGWELAIASVITIVVLAFVIVLPSSPGYVGITQIAFIFSLGYFGIPEADAVGASVIFNLTQYIPITVLGIIFFFKEGLSFRQIRKEVRQH